MRQDRLQLRAEVQLIATARDVQRLDANSVARQHQAPAEFVQMRDREHAAQLLETGGVPLQESMQNGLGIAVGVERVPGFLQFGTKFQVVVNLAVEDDDGVPVIRLE